MSETKKRAQIAPFFQFLQIALKLGLQSGSKRFAPRIVGAVLYTAVIALLLTALFGLRDPAVLRIAFFSLLSLALLIYALIALPDLHPAVGNFLAALVTVCFVGTLIWGAVRIAELPGERESPAPTPVPPRFEVRGRVRFSDHRPVEGAEVSIPLLRLSDRTNANGNFYLGQVDRVPGVDTLDLQIAIEDTVFRRRIALDAASLDIVLAYVPPVEAPPHTPVVLVPPGEVTPAESERRPPEPTTGSVVGHVDAAIGGQQDKHFGMTVTGSGTCRLYGRVQVTRSGSPAVHVIVLTADEFEKYRVRDSYSEIFRERGTSDYTLDVELPGPGRYEMVVSNRKSWLTPTYVLVENVRWECAGGNS
ncbi:MAG TPA: hypothetical protein VEY93_00920 [Longimicrobium sp.]|nr:hypothetical protein [Longimicrobium sp.]